MTADNLRLLSPQWPLIVCDASLVVRMMDALLVVKQCSCSADQRVTPDPVAGLGQDEQHTYGGSGATL